MTDEITLDAPETRIERFLAAAAGVEGITLDEPETRIERYLYKIAQSSGGVPAVEDADKGKYLHANESTGALEWAEGGSGGGVLVVTDTEGTLDKTWQEIHDAFVTGAVRITYSNSSISNINRIYSDANTFGIQCVIEGKSGAAVISYVTSSADGYPAAE